MEPVPRCPEIASRSGLSRAATRRLVLTLEHLGYLRANGREYALSPRVLELGYGFLGGRNVTDLAQPYMERLAHQVNESCSMAVLDGQSIVYVARVPVRKVMTVTLAVGARLPAFCTSMGRALLSGLPTADLERWLQECAPVARTNRTVTDRARLRQIMLGVQRDGYAWVEQELEIGPLLARGARARPQSARRCGAESGHAVPAGRASARTDENPAGAHVDGERDRGRAAAGVAAAGQRVTCFPTSVSSTCQCVRPS